MSIHGRSAPPTPSNPEKSCPNCGQGGKVVDLQTVKAMLTPEAMRTLDIRSDFSFCAQSACPIVYHSMHQSFEKSALRVPVFQKDSSPEATVCYCFGFTRDTLAGKEASSDASRKITAWVKAGLCACEIRNPQGSCCLGNIARLP